MFSKEILIMNGKVRELREKLEDMMDCVGDTDGYFAYKHALQILRDESNPNQILLRLKALKSLRKYKTIDYDFQEFCYGVDDVVALAENVLN